MDPLESVSIMLREWILRRELRLHYGEYLGDNLMEVDDHNMDRMHVLADDIMCLIHEHDLLISNNPDKEKE